MSLLAVDLIHVATIQRATTTTDDWNTDGNPTWNDHIVDQPCRLWVTAGRETVTDKTTVVVIEDIRLFLPLGVDVTAADRVGDITSRGDTILAGPLQVRAVLAHEDHLELVIVKAT